MGKKRLWLVKYRIDKELSQIELAELCNTSNKTISNIERGYREPSGKLAKRIADVLEFDMSLFYEDQSA